MTLTEDERKELIEAQKLKDLRDKFAGQALQGLIDTCGNVDIERVWGIADAMIAARGD